MVILLAGVTSGAGMRISRILVATLTGECGHRVGPLVTGLSAQRLTVGEPCHLGCRQPASSVPSSGGDRVRQGRARGPGDDPEAHLAPLAAQPTQMLCAGSDSCKAGYS
jgi:hypothetical protein